MRKLSTLMSVIAIAAVFGLVGPTKADPPTKGVNSQFAFTVPFIDIEVNPSDYPYDATCADDDEDGQCDGSIAFITKSGFWGVQVRGVEANDAGEFTVCLLDFGDPGNAWPVAQNLNPEGPKNTISAGGNVYATIGEDTVLFPSFALIAGNPPDTCFGHLVQFAAGIRVD